MRLTIFIYILFFWSSIVCAADPIVLSPSRDTIVACSTADVEMVLAEWYQSAGGAEAQDPDGGAITFSGDISLQEAIDQYQQSSSMMCQGEGTVTVTFTATDTNGESSQTGTATFSTVDNVNPVIQQIPTFPTHKCQEGIRDILIDWIKNRGGAQATDACSDVRWTDFIWNDTNGNSGLGSIDDGPYPNTVGACQQAFNVSFFVVDDCGNQRATTGSFTIIDDTPPIFPDTTSSITVSCDDIPDPQDIAVFDFCDPTVVISSVDESSQQGSPTECAFYNYTITRYFTATDACGNEAMDTLMIHVRDLGPPLISNNDTIAISCAEFNNGDTVLVSAVDDCSEVIISYEDTDYDFTCLFTVDRTYTLSDVCGNTVTYDQHIIVTDIDAPVFNIVPLDTVILCDQLDVANEIFDSWLARLLQREVVDDCTEASIFAAVPGTYDLDDVSTYPGVFPGGFDGEQCTSDGHVRSETIDLVIHDECGNATAYPLTFSIDDTTPPILMECVPEIDTTIQNSDCTIDLEVPILSVEEDCSDELIREVVIPGVGRYSITEGNNTIQLVPSGTYMATYIVTNCAGLIAECSFSISIKDGDPPVFVSCSPNDTIIAPADACIVEYTLEEEILVSDNCFLADRYLQTRPTVEANSLITFSSSPQGTLQANNKSYSFTGVDSIRYTELPATITVELLADVESSEAYFTVFGEQGFELGVTPTGTHCESIKVEYEIDVSTFNTWAADGEIDISLIANIAPDAIMPCSDLTGNTDNVSKVTATLTYSDAVITYAVSGATTIANTTLTPSTTVDLTAGENIVTYITYDGGDNRDTCQSTVVVIDNTLPEVVCKNTVINIHPDGEQSYILDANLVDDGSSDACSDVTLTVRPDAFSCDQLGEEVEVWLIATDVSGNKDSCQARVRVEPFDLEPSFSAGVCVDDTLKLFANAPTPTTPGTYTYIWEGPQYSSTDANPIIPNANNSNNGLYTVTVTGFGGCSASGSVLVTIDALTTPTIGANQDTVCIGDNLILTATDYTGDITYQWYEGQFPDGDLVGETSSSSIVLEPKEGQTTYYVVVESTSCVSNPSAIQPIVGLEKPTAMVNDVFINICEGEDISLGTSSFGSGYEYSWVGPDGFISEKPFPDPITDITAANAGEYALVVSVGSCLSDTAITRVNVFEKPVQPIITSGQTFCEGSTVSLTVNNIQNADLYTWYLNGNLFTTDTDNSLVIPNAQTNVSGLWQVSVRQGICTSDTSAGNNIVIEDLQDISITTSGAACEGDSIQLFVTFVAGAEYIWTGPQGVFSNKQNPKILAVPGDYSVQIVTGTNCESSASTSISVDTAPVITALSNNSMPCMDGETNIVFFPTVVPADPSFTYSWTGPNGFISDEVNPTILNPTEEDNGVYTLTVISDNCASEPRETVVDLAIIPDQPEIMIPNFICAGETVEFSSSIVVEGNTYSWNTPNGLETTTEPILVIENISEADEGEYTLFITIGDCDSEVSIPVQVTITNQPNPPAFTTNTPVCYGENIVLTISNPDPEEDYLWRGPFGIVGSGAELIIENATEINQGNYAVLRRRGECNSDFGEEQAVVVKDSILTPRPEIVMYELCSDGESAFEICIQENTILAEATYLITNVTTGTVLGTTTERCITIVDNGGFSIGENILVIAAEIEGCTSSDSDAIRVEVTNIPSQTADIVEGNQQVCEGEAVTLSSAGSGDINYTWSTDDEAVIINDPSSQSPQFSNITQNITQVVLSYSQGVCIDYSRDSIEIILAQSPVAFDDEYEIQEREPTILTVLDNDDTYGEVSLSIEEEPFLGRVEILEGDLEYTPDEVLSGVVTFSYEICSVDCPDLCSQATVDLIIGDVTDCVPPTIITPNDDGINDKFEISCLDVGGFSNSSLTVFNQWGDQVYRSSSYTNDWGGTYEGKPLDAGTYYYIFDIGDGSQPIHSFLIIQK